MKGQKEIITLYLHINVRIEPLIFKKLLLVFIEVYKVDKEGAIV